MVLLPGEWGQFSEFDEWVPSAIWNVHKGGHSHSRLALGFLPGQDLQPGRSHGSQRMAVHG